MGSVTAIFLLIALLALWYLVVHYVSDFVMQTPHMAVNKSKSNRILAHHVLVQTCWMYLAVIPTYFFIDITLWFVVVFFPCNFILHFATDWCTSRMTAHYFKQQNMRRVFQVVGIDQGIHYATYIGIVFGCLIYTHG